MITVEESDSIFDFPEDLVGFFGIDLLFLA
jgi:hypothetical protein